MSLPDLTRRLKVDNRKALVAFLTAGFPDEATFLRLVRAAADAGCDVIEVGVPFSDPIADGPLIQASSKAALERGMSLRRCIGLARELAFEIPPPLVFMSYYNPILQMGLDTFAGAAAEAGVCGSIVPDVPYEESREIREAIRSRGLTYVDLVAPTSSDRRIAQITDGAEGFVYLVSVTGVTGVRSPDAGALEEFVDRVREHTDVPLYVGFGISDAERASRSVRAADGVIIGSALVRLIQGARTLDAATDNVATFLRGVRDAIDAPARVRNPWT